MLASRCTCKRTARKLPRCGTGTRAKSTYCDLSSFGPALFEIWWPDIYLGGPYGPVKDKMYWPELVRRSEKCVGPAGQCLCRGLHVLYKAAVSLCLSVCLYPPFFRHDRRTATKFGTHIWIDCLSPKKLTYPTPGVISRHL